MIRAFLSFLPLPPRCPWAGFCLAVLAAAMLAPRDVAAADFAYLGACDASGAVALDADHFAAVSDEDNWLRIYQRGVPGLPLQRFDLAPHLRPDPRRPETDLEAGARLGDTIYWIGSHSRSSGGKDRPGRDRFFATRFHREGDRWRLEFVGVARVDLARHLIAAPGLTALRLAEAAERSPREAQALNIEGLSATPEGELLIGFRNPLHEGRAVLVPLKNPAAYVTGAAPAFGAFVTLPLGGHGIRDIMPWREGYLIASGAPFSGGRHQLWFWPGGDAAPLRLRPVPLKGFDVEAIVAYPGVTDAVELLSDDSSDSVDGAPCGDLPEAQRRFRSLTVTLPDSMFEQDAR